MASFYVDYENVHNRGTYGIEQISNEGCVFLFYSQNANTMNMDTVKQFMNSRCCVEFIEAEAGIVNALDFQLITFLYTSINQDDFHYIISKDRGYDAALKMGNRIGIDNVFRFNTIEEALKHYNKNQVIDNLNDDNLNDDNLNDDNINDTVLKEECDYSEPEISDIPDSLSTFLLLEPQPEQVKAEPSLIKSDIVCKIDEEKYRKLLKERIKKLVQKDSNITLPKDELEISCDGIFECDNKMKLYHFLRKKLGDKRGKFVYTALNEEFTLLKTDLAM